MTVMANSLIKKLLGAGLAFSLLAGCEKKPSVIKETVYDGFPTRIETHYGRTFFGFFSFGDQRVIEMKDTVSNAVLRAYDENSDMAYDYIKIDPGIPKGHPL